MDRRGFVKGITGIFGVAAMHTRAARAEEGLTLNGEIKAIAFDGLVIFDPRSVEKRVEKHLPGRSAEFTALWRTRQFEYSWLRTAGRRYTDFWRVTEEGLRYTAKSLKIALSDAQHDDLMNTYLSLSPWPDVRQGLAQLRKRGVRLAFLSNFTAAMLDANLEAAGLSEFFEPHLTTDLVKAYKPSPQAYQMGPEAFGLQKREIAFAAFAGWDAAGAKWFGYPTVWVNRGGAPTEELDAQPDTISGDMNGLIRAVLRSG